MVKSIALATDFSEAGRVAFEHALRLALVYRCQLDLLHVRGKEDDSEWEKFPHVRETLERWHILPSGAQPHDVEPATGVSVRKVDIYDTDAAGGLGHFLAENRPDLMVMATHGRVGLNRWLSGSVSLEILGDTRIPVLLFGPKARAFVDSDTGDLHLRTIMVPVDDTPNPNGALRRIESLLARTNADFDIFHIGDKPPRVVDKAGRELPVRIVQGHGPVELIIGQGVAADMLAMPTAGRHGFLDAIRGSTTERVVHEALCPVLAVYSK
ncbi:MAG: universal stress protein [Sphingomonadaceae bacterium]